jgi:regulation of enolase protein 1 (concanavalin A-like superfamily)
MTTTRSTDGRPLSIRRALLLLIFAIGTVLPGTAVAQMLPAGWAAADVGAPAIPGVALYSGETYTVSAAGTGVGAASDQFTFVYRAITGDATIFARVDALPATMPDAQAGVMIRQGLGAGAKHGAVIVSSTRGMAFTRRKSGSGNTTTTAVTPARAPVWIRVDRRGSTMTASWSVDGVTWQVIGVDTVNVTNVLYVGLAVSSRTVVAPVQMAFSGVQALSLVQYGGPLPDGWSSRDIGAPARSGAAAFDSGTFGIEGSGTDIAGTWDQFHFASREAAGDVDVVARVRDLGNTDSMSKAGIMIRDSVTANGAHASMFATTSGVSLFRRRAAAGSVTVDTTGPTKTSPVWLKLSLRNGAVSGYQSVDGVTWTLVGTDTLTLPTPFRVGLAVTSRKSTATVITNIDNVAVNVVAAGNVDPAVSLTAPADGATFTAPANITITATATDTDGTVVRVEFYQGSTLLGSDTTSPYSFAWNNVPAGSYSLTARAVDDDGAITTSAARTISVSTATAQRSAAFTASADHNTLVNSYLLEIFAAGANPATAAPIATQNLGKPAVVNGECTVDVTTTINGLSPGTYQATVSAVGSGGSARSGAATFSR